MNQLYRKHFSVLMREKSIWNSMIHQAFFGIKPKTPLKCAKITITRHSSGELDSDNLISTGKQLIDALKSNLIIEDDTHANIGRPRFIQTKSKRKVQYTTIMISEIDKVDDHQCECKFCGNFI